MPVQISRSVRILFVATAAASLAGCSGGEDKWSSQRPTPVPASGTVLHKGQPVAEATVLFVPDGHKHPAVGRTDTSGRFQLQTFAPDDGAVPGEYKVAVRKMEVSSTASGSTDDAEAPEADERSLLPEGYGNPALSGLTASVKEGAENNFTFELTDGPAGAAAAGAARAPVSRGE